jgi:uncharacterized tellurite resistance protein B-like protein
VASLLDFLSTRLTTDTGYEQAPRTDAIRLATAALLVEMARADFEESSLERNAVKQLLARHFDLSKEESRLLLEEAETQADRSVSLYRFTHLLHERLSTNEKHSVIELLWRVALADSHLDKYEDALVHKVADLLYISHTDLMRLKARAQAQ